MEPKDEIKQRIDVVELISETLTLKPAGGGSFRAVCPFHAEKTPSFFVSRDKQIWHCFGCGVGGDIFAFVMQMEGVDFAEALRLLAQKAGVEIPRFSSQVSNERQRLSETIRRAARFYHHLLMEHPAGEEARTYLAHRGITKELCEKFGLGVAPKAWDRLSHGLLTKGTTKQELMAAGLSVARKEGSGVIDRFRDRIMVPLCDAHGQVVGFTARLYTKDGQGPKYLNSPETELYHKGQLLFGLDLAKTAIRKHARVIVVEGNLDVVASHKAGVEEVVASSGTALTRDQLSLLFKYTTTIIFSFDDDAAGFAAARKGMEIAREIGFTVKVCVIPEGVGKDPDEVVQKDPALWREIVSAPVSIVEYLLAQAMKGKDVRKLDDKKAISDLVLPELVRIKDPLEEDHWVRLLADTLLTDAATIRASLAALRQKHAPSKPSSPLKSTERKKPHKDTQAAEMLIGYACLGAQEAGEILAQAKAEWFVDPLFAQLYKAVQIAYKPEQSPSISPSSFFDQIQQILRGFPEAEALIPSAQEAVLRAESTRNSLAPKEVRAWIDDCLTTLSLSSRDQERKRLADALREAERQGNTSRVVEVLEQLRDLS